jgi:hypothetical protein
MASTSKPTPARPCSAGCGKPAALVCGRCRVAAYDSVACQRKAWARHKLWCPLVGTAVPADGLDGKVTFLGQWRSSLLELATHPSWAPKTFTGGATRLPRISMPEDADGLSYVSLASFDAEALRELRARPGAADVVLPARSVCLNLDYCLGTSPLFLLEAPAQGGGFSAADLAGACAYAYQWCYAMESAAIGGGRPSHPMLMNRGSSAGPFEISMHDLEDLQLHSFALVGSLPAASAGAAAAGDSDSGAPPAPVTLLLWPDIDS